MILGRALSEVELLAEIDAHCRDAGITRSAFLRRARGRTDSTEARNNEILARYDRGEAPVDLARRFGLSLNRTHEITKVRRQPRPKLIQLSDGSYKIPLTQGLFATVDDSDLEMVSKFRWHAFCPKDGQTSYASAHDPCKAQKKMFMHRLIMDATKGVVVDHINGDGLDNRRINLRVASVAQNAWNVRSKDRPRAGYHGVIIQSGKYLGSIMAHGNTLRTAVYDTPEEAAAARDALARLHHGEFATLNFPGAAAP